MIQLTVHIEPSWVRNFSRPIAKFTWILAAILDHNMTYIDMAYNITVYRYVLTDKKSVKYKEIVLKWQ